jgi:hypothetical protein
MYFIVYAQRDGTYQIKVLRTVVFASFSKQMERQKILDETVVSITLI